MRRIGGVVAILLILGPCKGWAHFRTEGTPPLHLRRWWLPIQVLSSNPLAAAATVASARLSNLQANASQPGADALPHSAEPIRVAQATTAAPIAPAPNVSAQPKPIAIPPCDKPGGMSLARIVEIDTTGGPGFGFEHFKQYDFLRDKEVVLTFDDGPWPGNTPTVLKALADECLKATFFEIGEHATWHPEITKQVIDAGMTVGTHTWSHGA